MIETDPEDDAYWVMRSGDLDHLISEINDHLAEHHPGCRVPHTPNPRATPPSSAPRLLGVRVAEAQTLRGPLDP